MRSIVSKTCKFNERKGGREGAPQEREVRIRGIRGIRGSC